MNLKETRHHPKRNTMAALAKPNPNKPREVGGITVVKSSNMSNIPEAVFIEDVNKFLEETSNGADVNDKVSRNH